MKVYILHQYFRTPEEGGGIRSYHLMRALASAGHVVEVITAWNLPTHSTRYVEGCTIHYLPVYYANSLSLRRRLWSFFRFFSKAFWLLAKKSKPDVLYAISTPLSTGILALILRRQRKVRYFFEIGDLWPDVPIQMGIIKNMLFIRWLKWLENLIYRHAHTLVAMSPPIFNYLRTAGYAQKTVLVTNFSDLSLKTAQNVASRKEFVISYTGAIGKANHLDFLLALAAEAQGRGLHQISFQVMGEGAEKHQLQERAKSNRLTNVKFIDFGSTSDAIRVLINSDLAYLSFDRFELLWTGSPNKYFDALAVGKPLLCNFGGWIASEIEAHKCGLSYDGTKPAEAITAIQQLIDNTTILNTMGNNAFQLASEKYSLEVQIPRWLKLFDI